MSSSYYLDSLVPSWLASDSGYLAALGEHLLDRMALQGYRPTGRPVIGDAAGEVKPPVGMRLLRVIVTVDEFDLDMGDDTDPVAAPKPAPSSSERYEHESDLVVTDDIPPGQWLVQQVDAGTAHVVPLDDVIVHDFDASCPCGPTPGSVPSAVDPSGRVVVHHSLDGREQREPDYGAAGE